MKRDSNVTTNLESFLDCTTPLVPSQSLSKSDARKLNKLWYPWERETLDYFVLCDLWKCFDEGSAYGVGVPIRSEDGQNLVQYFVPYLSAIQIFTSSSISCLREETETMTRDSLSDSLSDESENEKLSRWDTCSSEEGPLEQDSFWLPNQKLGNLYFQYFERSSPYSRAPLVDKIRSQSKRYPGLMSLRSVDLSPASWMAVAWYPIYHIPSVKTIKDLQTCFLTYHTLSSWFEDMELERDKEKAENRIALPPFGLATYKMQGKLWLLAEKNGDEIERMSSLFSAADSWLKQLQVRHHDFNFFMGFRHG